MAARNRVVQGIGAGGSGGTPIQIAGGFEFPGIPPITNPGTTTNMTVSSATIRAAVIGQVVWAGDDLTKTIDRVWYYPGAVVSAGGSSVRVSLRDVSTTSGPPFQDDGVVDQFRTALLSSVTATAWTQTGLITSDGTDTGLKRTIAREEQFCVVFDLQSFAGSDSIRIDGYTNTQGGGGMGISGNSLFNGATWAQQPGNAFLIFEFSDGTYGTFSTGQIGTSSSVNLNSGGSPVEAGMRFIAPFTGKLDGFYAWFNPGGGNVDCSIYEGTGAADTLPSQTVSFDANAVAESQLRLTYVRFNPTTVFKGQGYRIAIRATTGTSIGVYAMNFPNNASMAALPGGVDMYWSQRDSGNWTDTNTRRLAGGLHYCEVTA